MKGRIRTLVDGDVDQIRDLWIENGGKAVPSAESLVKRFFAESAWRDSGCRPLVYEGANGRLLGCLAMTPRPMIFRDRSIRAVVGHHFIIDSSRAGARAGIELVRRFLNGSQDLSVAVWNDFGRRIWSSFGGTVAPFHSLSWTRALMPAQYMLQRFKDRGLPLSAAVALSPACRALDATLKVLRKRSTPVRPAEAMSDDLDAVTMVSYVSAFASDRALRPCYDAATLRWLLDTIAEEGAHRGKLHKVAVRTHSGRPLGWYVYYLTLAGAAEVLQVGGKDDALADVIEHLFAHAHQRGAVAVSGPMDARLVGALSDKQCAFHRPRNTWALFHSHDPRITEAIHSGDAFLSRIESAPWVDIES